MTYVKLSSFGNDFGDIALEWYERSIDNKYSDLENTYNVCEQVALLFRSGTLKIGMDYSKAAKWFDKRLKSPYDDYDVPIYQHIADFYYSGGPCLNKDYFSAVYCYRKATNRGVIQKERNHLNVARMHYEGGFGIEKSYVEALFWCHKILLHKDNISIWIDACLLLAKMFREGGHGIDKNNAIALRLYKETRGLDCIHHRTFQIAMAEIYEEGGFGVERNYHRAYNIYMEQSSLRHSYSMYKVGHFHELGLCMERNCNEAFKYYLKAAEVGCSYGANAIGKMYLHGLLFQQDYSEALLWFEKAIKHDAYFAEPYNHIGYIYERGSDNIEKDYTKAMEYYKSAASLEDSKGQLNMGKLYFKGLGVPADKETALKYFEQSFNNGSKEAQQYIQECKDIKQGELVLDSLSLEELTAKLNEIEETSEMLKERIQQKKKKLEKQPLKNFHRHSTR
jgi:TPR repeat protein